MTGKDYAAAARRGVTVGCTARIDAITDHVGDIPFTLREQADAIDILRTLREAWEIGTTCLEMNADYGS
jgi:hypothetical protein